MVICASCQHSNSPKAKFCAKCGGSLAPGDGDTRSGADAETGPVADETRAEQAEAAPLSDPAPGIPPIPPMTESRVESGGLQSERESAGEIQSAATALQTDNEVNSVIEEARAEIAAETDLPVCLALNFSKVLISGHNSTIDMRIENNGASPVENLTLLLESNAFRTPIETSYRRAGAGQVLRDILEIEPAKPGNFVLRCTVRFSQGGQTTALRGVRGLRINEVPAQSNFVINISDIQSNRGAAANAGLGGEYGDVKISNLIPQEAVRTLNDLLNFDLPEAFEPVPLELDYEVSQIMARRIEVAPSKAWTIPAAFLHHVQPGTRLKLDPVQADASADFIRGIRLVARSEFLVGKSREDADFLAWFWPRSKENDDRTRRISRVHVTCEARRGQVFIREAGSTNGSTFEGHALSPDEDEAINRRGTLVLAHEYHLDVTPYDTTLPAGLQIANESRWVGPEAATSPMRGCMRFIPTNSELALYDTLWLFTDANFGSSRMNALVIELPGVAEVEGRFHHYRGSFWIEALESGTVRVGGHALRPQEIAPLIDGEEIIIGGTAFRASVVA